MENKMVREVDKCVECGKMWDLDGCSVSGESPFEVVSFRCSDCEARKVECERIKLRDEGVDE